MKLEEALPMVDELTALVDKLASPVAGKGASAMLTRHAEALRVVSAKARENLAAETVAKVNALSARALEMNKPHVFDWPLAGGARYVNHKHCGLCGALESDPIHKTSGGAT